MAIISYAKTVNEYIAGKKTCTRRNWSLRQTRLWQKFWDDGKLVHTAYDKLPRNGGKPIGQFRLTCRPYREQLHAMPEDDLIKEGGMCKTLGEFYVLIQMSSMEIVTVIRFEKL